MAGLYLYLYIYIYIYICTVRVLSSEVWVRILVYLANPDSVAVQNAQSAQVCIPIGSVKLWLLSGYCLVTVWLLSGYCLVTVCRLSRVNCADSELRRGISELTDSD
jgi:hypothetical protein